MRFDELVDRVRDTLVRLETLSEGKVNAQQFEASGPTHGSKDAAAPAQEQSTADHFVTRLERWCGDAERRIDQECKGEADQRGQLPELNADQREFWVITCYQGVDYRMVAEHEGLATSTVMRIRRKAGLDERKGLPNPDQRAA